MTKEAKEKLSYLKFKTGSRETRGVHLSITHLYTVIMAMAVYYDAIDTINSDEEQSGIDIIIDSSDDANFKYRIYKDCLKSLEGFIICEQDWFNMYCSGGHTLSSVLKDGSSKITWNTRSEE